MLAARSVMASANTSRGWTSELVSMPIVMIRLAIRRLAPSSVRQTKYSCFLSRMSTSCSTAFSGLSMIGRSLTSNCRCRLSPSKVRSHSKPQHLAPGASPSAVSLCDDPTSSYLQYIPCLLFALVVAAFSKSALRPLITD